MSVVNWRDGCCVVPKGYIFGTKSLLVIFCIEFVVCGVCDVVEWFKDVNVRPFDLRAVCTELYRKRQPGNKICKSCFLISSSLVVTDVTWVFIVHMISMDKNIPARAKDFLSSKTARTDSGPPSFLFNGYWASFQGISRPGREVYHSHSSTAEVANQWICTSSSPICLYGVDRYYFAFTFRAKVRTPRDLFTRVTFLPKCNKNSGQNSGNNTCNLNFGSRYNIGRDSSVGTATHKGLDVPGIEFCWGRDFPHPSRRPLSPPSFRVSFPGIKLPGRGVDRPPHLASGLNKE